MKIVFLFTLILGAISSQAATDWSNKLGSFVPDKFLIPKDKLKGLALPEAKELVKKTIGNHYLILNGNYKTRLKLDYSPFGGKWQMGRLEMELNQILTLDQLQSDEFETKVNTIILSDYKEFIGSEFVLSNHKIFDHELEIYNLKKEIIFLTQQIEVLKKTSKDQEEPTSAEQGIPYIFIIATLIGAAGISILIKRAKFI